MTRDNLCQSHPALPSPVCTSGNGWGPRSVSEHTVRWTVNPASVHRASPSLYTPETRQQWVGAGDIKIIYIWPSSFIPDRADRTAGIALRVTGSLCDHHPSWPSFWSSRCGRLCPPLLLHLHHRLHHWIVVPPCLDLVAASTAQRAAAAGRETLTSTRIMIRKYPRGGCGRYPTYSFTPLFLDTGWITDIRLLVPSHGHRKGDCCGWVSREQDCLQWCVELLGGGPEISSLLTTITGQYPGPLIEADWGDTLRTPTPPPRGVRDISLVLD